LIARSATPSPGSVKASAGYGLVRLRTEANMNGRARLAGSAGNDPEPTSAQLGALIQINEFR
jgi:hypothetical protein